MRIINKLIYLGANNLRHYGVRFGEETDPRVMSMKKEIQKIGGKIEFKIEQYPDGSWTAESTNIDSIITGGTTTKYITQEIRDATFTYFGIPPHLCNDTLLTRCVHTILSSRPSLAASGGLP